MNDINVSQEDREIVAENIAGNKSASYGTFLDVWGHLEHLLLELALLGASDEERRQRIFRFKNNLRALLNILLKEQRIISRELRSEILEILKFRNVIVHHADAIFTEESVQNRIRAMESCLEELSKILINLQLKEFPDKEQRSLEEDLEENLGDDSQETEDEDDASNDKS